MIEQVGLGLFHGTICSMMKDMTERCKSVSVNEAIYALNHEVSFMQTGKMSYYYKLVIYIKFPHAARATLQS